MTFLWFWFNHQITCFQLTIKKSTKLDIFTSHVIKSHNSITADHCVPSIKRSKKLGLDKPAQNLEVMKQLHSVHQGLQMRIHCQMHRKLVNQQPQCLIQFFVTKCVETKATLSWRIPKALHYHYHPETIEIN